MITDPQSFCSFLDEKRSVQFLKEQNSLLIGEDGQAGYASNAMDMAA